MTDFNEMTTEELTNRIESLMVRFEEATENRTKLALIQVIERIETIRDSKSWDN